MRRITIFEMELGDIVMPLPETIDDIRPYSSATVVKIDKVANIVELFRPYTHTSDVEYSSGLLTYTGSERYPIPLKSREYYLLLERRSTPII